jgi:leucyl aminopeptidase
MKISFSTRPDRSACTVRLVTKVDRPKLPKTITEAEFSGAPNTRVFLHAENQLCVGVGDPRGVVAETIRRAAGTAAMTLRKSGRPRFTLDLTPWPQFAAPAVEGLVLGSYRYEDFKTKRTDGLQHVTVVVPKVDLPAAQREGKRAAILAEMTNLARRVANQPGNVVYPATLAEQAEWHAKAFGLRCTVFNEKKLRAGKFGGILSVGQGSARPPRLIVLEHPGRKAGKLRSAPPLVLVGKAVTFDTGGISIKPAAEMENMIWDKCGGCAVLGAMLAIARLGVKRHVIGLIPAAENMVSANAYRPGDIVKCHDGKQVEIVNTDAEGRMLLADCIGYARRKLNAAAIVDVATLTGACGVALGDALAGLWSTNDTLRDQLLAAGKAAGERLWPMPLEPEHEEQIRSEMALIKNSGGRLGGACTAAAFLKCFAEKTPWAHLDIAYTSRSTKELPWLARGATGFAVRTLVGLAEK